MKDRINEGDIVSVSFHGAQITLIHYAKVLHKPVAIGDSWIFEEVTADGQMCNIHYVSEGCTVSKYQHKEIKKLLESQQSLGSEINNVLDARRSELYDDGVCKNVNRLCNYWISWYHDVENHGDFELHYPWWRTDSGGDSNLTIVAAIRASSENAAKQLIIESYIRRMPSIEWRFCTLKPDDWSPDWSPFCDRFPRKDSMNWFNKNSS